jgi:transposase
LIVSMCRIGPPTRLAYEAVQEIRIKYRWEALDKDNEAIIAAKEAGVSFEPEILENGDSVKQLLARSRYLLFRHRDKWYPPKQPRIGS